MEQYSLTVKEGEKIIATLRSQGAVVGYLFGSRARGTAQSRSDVDLGVAFPPNISVAAQEERVERIRASLEMVFGKDKVDVVNVGTVNNPLLRYTAVLGEGITLFADDTSLRNVIARRALRDFEDTRHLRSIQERAIEHLFVSRS